MNENLLYIVARHNLERIYGDGRFDFIDNDFIEAVVTVGEELAGSERTSLPRGTKLTSSKKKMAVMAARTRERRSGAP